MGFWGEEENSLLSDVHRINSFGFWFAQHETKWMVCVTDSTESTEEGDKNH